MNEALKWAVEKSKAPGAARAVLLEVARKADGCVARCRPAQLMHEAGVGRRKFYEQMSLLEESRDVERLTNRFDKEKFRAYHLPKYCESLKRFCPLNSASTVDGGNLLIAALTTPREECTDPIHRNRALFCGNQSSVEKVQPLLFQESLTKDEARQVCEDCGGTAIRTVLYQNADGEMVQGAAPCRHTKARLVGRWGLAGSKLIEQFLWAQLRPKRLQGSVGQFRLD